MFKLHTRNTTLKTLQNQLLKDKPHLRKGNREAMQIIPIYGSQLKKG
jgi:hypothetical protein